MNWLQKEYDRRIGEELASIEANVARKDWEAGTTERVYAKVRKQMLKEIELWQSQADLTNRMQS